MSGLLRGFAIALLAIFALLAIPFGSYVQPLIVMSAIPFGMIGAVWGHLIMGYDLAIISVFGIVALTGVVVNDSLVLVDFINREFKEGAAVDEGDTPGWGGPLQTRPDHLADDLRRPHAAAAGEEPAGQVPHPNGHLPRLRRSLRHLHHADPGAGAVPDPGRPERPRQPPGRFASR